MRYLFAVLLLFGLVGCIPFSDQPLTDPGRQPMDWSVYGSWYWKDNDESGLVHIGLDKKSNALTILMVELDKDGEIEVSEFTGHTSSLQNNKYFNLKWVRPADENPGYMFVKYEVEKDKLWISLMAPDDVEKSVKAGSLKGELIAGDWISSVHIMTDDQQQLQQYVLEHDAGLFKERACLFKLHLRKPSAPPAVNSSAKIEPRSGAWKATN